MVFSSSSSYGSHEIAKTSRVGSCAPLCGKSAVLDRNKQHGCWKIQQNILRFIKLAVMGNMF